VIKRAPKLCQVDVGITDGHLVLTNAMAVRACIRACFSNQLFFRLK